MSKVYTVLLVIAGLVVTMFILFITGNITIKTEPAATDSSTSAAKLSARKVVYVLDNEELPANAEYREVSGEAVRG